MSRWRWQGSVTRSFRTRIALAATGTAMVGMVALFVVASVMIVARRQTLLDTVLHSHLAGPVLRDAPPGQWPAFEYQLDASFSGFSEPHPKRPRVLLLAQDGQGRTLFRSAAWPASLREEMLPRPVSADCEGSLLTGCRPLPADTPHLSNIVTAGDTWRVGAIEAGGMDGGRHRIWVAVNRTLPAEMMMSVAFQWLIGVAALLVLLAVLSWSLARRALRPVYHLTEAIVGIKANDLNQRVRADDEAREFAQLVTVFNDMLDRLQRSFTQAVRFSGDAAHELKTPLTIMQGELERCFERAKDDLVMEQSLSRTIDEVRRLDSIVRKLLLLSRADAGQLNLPMLPFDLRPLIDELAEDIGMMAPERAVRVVAPDHIWVRGDWDLLAQILQNLVSNALKYGLPGEWIELRAVRKGERWHIDVANASAGIAPEHRERLFDRFYRGDPAHQRKIGGMGLGLALAREIAHAHAGKLILLRPEAGRETFRLTLPADPDAPA
ncbi:MAG: ATP-binding protein [Pseudomonadota bacterium]